MIVLRAFRAILGIALALAFGAARAEDFEVRAFVQPEGRVTDTQPVQLVVRVEGNRLVDVSIGKFPELENLRILSGPAKSTNTSFVMDGLSTRTTATTTLSYTLLPAGPGQAVIPSIAVKVGGTIYSTPPIRLDVVRGATAPPPADRPGTRPSREAEEASGGFDVFLRAQVSGKDVFVNQPVLLEVTLFTAVAVSSPSWAEEPDLRRFWSEDVAVNPDAERYQTTVGGRAYWAIPLLRKVLMPTTAGDVTIDPFVLQLQVRRRSRDIFQDFFQFGGMQAIARKTDAIRIHVKPLPEASRPPSFGGAVGSFRMNVTLDRTEAQVNDAIALKATVQGEGSLQSVPAPTWPQRPELKVFEPKVTESKSTAGGKLTSQKTWEWVVVPLVPGDLEVPALRFSFFDPTEGAYREVEGVAQKLLVRRGAGSETIAEATAHGEVREQLRDIAFIKPLRGRLADSRVPIERRPVFLALAAFPVVAAPLLIAAGRRRSRLKGNRGLARSRRAGSKARKEIKAAARDLSRSDSGTFHERVSRLLLDYVADRFDRSAAGLTYDATDELLATRSVEPDIRRRLRACLETCDFARFVPAQNEAERKASVLREAETIVDLLERAL